MVFKRTTRLLSLLTALVIVTGCGPGEVSPATYEYSKALYSITNRQASDMLSSFNDQVAEAESNGELSSSEADLLRAIIDQAVEGDWKSASQECRAIMEAQVEGR